jgi:hypothetical protein
MSDDEAVVRLLTEIRDNQLKQLSLREEALRLTQLALARQRRSVRIMFLILSGILLIIGAIKLSQPPRQEAPRPAASDRVAV